MNALPLILFFLATIAIGYRYYSAFLAAKVMALDDARITPAHSFRRWPELRTDEQVRALRHHFARSREQVRSSVPCSRRNSVTCRGFSGSHSAVVFAGAAHDFVILVSSMRRNGRSLAEIRAQ